MRIAVIGTRGGGPARDGVDQALGEIYPRLIRRGHDVDIFTERNGHGVAAVAGARMIRLPSMPMPFADGTGHAVLASLMGAFRSYDVVNFVAADAASLFTLAAKLGRHRTVVSVHGLGRASPWPGLSLGPEASAAHFADVITVVSKRLERFFRDAYGREAIYIPNGIRRLDAPPLPALPGLDPGRSIVVAGRMTEESGLALAVAAMAGMPEGWRLVVAETGDGDAAYAQSVRQAADPLKTLFLGRVDEALLDALTAHSYLYVLPSRTEEAAPALVRALAHGGAVVVSDQPEHLDVVGGDGFTFTTGDAGDLRRVLRWLLDDPEVVARMRLRAAAAAATRFCWDRIADAYEQVYASIA